MSERDEFAVIEFLDDDMRRCIERRLDTSDDCGWLKDGKFSGEVAPVCDRGFGASTIYTITPSACNAAFASSILS
jgi:hypothetical protein